MEKPSESAIVRHSIIGLIIFSAHFLFSDILLSWLASSFILEVIIKIPIGPITDIIALIFFSIIFYKNAVIPGKNDKQLEVSSTIQLLLFCILYLIFIRNNEFITFQRLSIMPIFNYMDILYGAAIIWNLKWNSLQMLEVTNHKLYYDNAFQIDEKLTNTRLPFVENLWQHIKTIKSDKSFNIAIIGSWGSGKSSALITLEKFIEKEPHSNTLVVKFNSWKYGNPAKIRTEFLQTFEETISKEDKRFKTVFQSYTSRISDLEIGWISKMVLWFNKNNWNELSESELYEKSNAIIEKTGKRFLFILDDLDRLTSKEILVVFNLIRNVSSFKHTVFVTALDLNYLRETLKKEREIAFRDKYLEKIFNLVIHLPPITKPEIFEELKTKIQAKFTDNSTKLQLEAIINHLFSEEVFPIVEKPNKNSLGIQIFEDFRKINQFCNSLSFILHQIDPTEIDLFDLFIVEIIKLQNPKTWTLLSLQSNEIFLDESTNMGVVRKLNRESGFYKKLQKNEVLVNLLDNLYSNELDQFKSHRSICYKHNHDLYFNNQLIGLISMKDYRSCWENSILDIMSFFQRLVDKKLENNLAILLASENTSNPSDPTILKKFLIKLWFSPARPSFISILVNDLAAFNLSTKGEKFMELLRTIFSTLDVGTRPLITLGSEIARALIYQTHKFDCTIDAVNDLQLKVWEQKYPNEARVDKSMLFDLALIISDIKEKKIIIASSACVQMGIRIKNDPINYLKLFFRFYGPFPDDRTYVGDPFMKSYLEFTSGKDELQEIINNCLLDRNLREISIAEIEFINSQYQRLKSNNFAPIQLTEEEEKYLTQLSEKVKQ